MEPWWPKIMLPKRQTCYYREQIRLAKCLIILQFIFIESVSQQVFIDPLEGYFSLSNKRCGVPISG